MAAKKKVVKAAKAPRAPKAREETISEQRLGRIERHLEVISETLRGEAADRRTRLDALEKQTREALDGLLSAGSLLGTPQAHAVAVAVPVETSEPTPTEPPAATPESAPVTNGATSPLVF